MSFRIARFVPDPEVLLAMPPEQLAGVLLAAFNSQKPPQKLHPGNISLRESLTEYGSSAADVGLAIMEAWTFLVNEGLIVLDPGNTDGRWYVLSRRGKSLKTQADFEHFRHASQFPKGSLHPEVTAKCYSEFLSGDYESAVFKACKAIEVAVKNKCGVGFEQHIGVPLMRAAFHPENGPLANQEEPFAERDALSFLFAGAMGRFKNPASHRNVPMNNAQEAIELLSFASHLLRIVEER